MELFPILSLVITAAAVLSWLNHKVFRLPTTIGVMVLSLLGSIAIMAVDQQGYFDFRTPAAEAMETLDLQHTLLDWMLAFLLFAGALHVNLGHLSRERWVIGALATVGVVTSTFMVGGLMYFACQQLGMEIRFLHCLLFGSLISPTDPIAVLGILKKAGAPKSLETQIAGESLFNDGIGVVVFTVLLTMAGGTHPGAVEAPMDFNAIAIFLGQEVGGSVLLGLAGGLLAYALLKTVDNYQVEILITLALAMGLYSLAMELHSSGPLAVVIAGLFIGNTGRALAMSETTVERVDTFWELVDEIFNVILFVLIGMEVLLLQFPKDFLIAGVLAIPLVLLPRWINVLTASKLLRRFGTFQKGTVAIMTWGGLRGGISVALALSISPGVPARDLILTMTYVVVVFSIVVQGLSVGPVIRTLLPKDSRA
ncbi:MAG: sodium:proton antiporter [Planctomycetota bacterium]|nr:MAG: sodium:proton antiporter [Planctomycetota bacterium]